MTGRIIITKTSNHKKPLMINSPEVFVFSAERTLPSSNLQPLNSLEMTRLAKVVSPHKIHSLKDEVISDLFLRDLTAINEFLFYVEAEPFVTPEKAENRKRVPFKKVAGGVVS